nr:MAG TPA: hypothetical protein [Caudoviricetes sp.]
MTVPICLKVRCASVHLRRGGAFFFAPPSAPVPPPRRLLIFSYTPRQENLRSFKKGHSFV